MSAEPNAERVSLREEWFEDENGNTHARLIDPDDLAVSCGVDNEPWPCSAAPAPSHERPDEHNTK